MARGCRLEIIVDQYPCKSDLEPLLWKCFYADNFYFYADWRISNNIFHFVTFEKSKTTCPFNGNEASRLFYISGLLTKLPGDHIPLLKSTCLACKSVAEAFVIVLAWLNPANADPIRCCLCGPFHKMTAVGATAGCVTSIRNDLELINIGSITILWCSLFHKWWPYSVVLSSTQ